MECCRGKCVPGPGCGCCGGCLFGGCEKLEKGEEDFCLKAIKHLPTTPGVTIGVKRV